MLLILLLFLFFIRSVYSAVKMSPGKTSTSLAATVDLSINASISSSTDIDDVNKIKDETKPDSTDNVNVRKAIGGGETIIAGAGIGSSADKNENFFKTKTIEERIKHEVSK